MRKVCVLLLSFLYLASVRAEDVNDEEIKKLRQEAKEESPGSVPTVSAPTPVFTSGERAQQALNPEISVVGDGGLRFLLSDFDPQSVKYDSGLFFRVLGLHFQADLDPYSFFKAAVEMNPEEIGLAEAYATFTNILPRLNLTAGKFRQRLGLVQRWHEHALDQFDFPLVIPEFLGEEGLCQIGVSLDLQLPSLWTDHMEITLQVTNQMNEALFSGQLFGPPAALLRWGQYFDLSPATYLEIGLSGIFGTNNRLNLENEQGQLYDEPWRTTTVGAADFTLSWAPPEGERYRHLTFRGEVFWLGKEIEGGYLSRWGGYAYLDAGLSESLTVGARGDALQLVEDEGRLWAATAYLTWWQSEWVGLRLQFSHRKPSEKPTEELLILQLMFAAGPHKHDKY
jgi:hypothetical protein